MALHGGGRRESFRRSLREKGPLSLRAHPSKRREGEIMTIAKSPVITMAPTTPVYDGIQIMVKEGFRRIPIIDPGTRRLQGILTASDILNYLGGGEKFRIIQREHAGNLFKAINEPVRHIMTREVFSVHTSAKISDAINIMVENKVGGIPVIDGEGRVWAIITERDIITIFGKMISGAKVSDLMSKKVVTATPETFILEAEKRMIKRGFRRLPIISGNKLVGIVTVMDILRFFGSGKVFQHLQSGTIDQVLQTPITEIAVKDVVTVGRNVDVGKAAQLMWNRGIGALPVVENEKLVGIITERDFFKLIVT
ncbi:MAG: CBS domain-containing protein [Candidatus Bathyarchaeaceae archaeon]